MDWDEEYDLLSRTGAGPSFIDRARNATPNDDFNAPMIAAAPPETHWQSATDETPLEQLIRHWINERHSPDILAAQDILLSSLLDHIRRQSETIQLLRSDPTSSEEEHIRIMLAQTEIERVKFIVRSYVRTRLYKIEKYARFITTDEEVQTRISAAERDYASRHANLTDRHFYLSVLQSLPETQAHLDDAPIFMPPMVAEPDKSRPVFVRARQRCPPIRLDDGRVLEMEKDHISLLPYSTIQQLVERGEVELV